MSHPGPIVKRLARSRRKIVAAVLLHNHACRTEGRAATLRAEWAASMTGGTRSHPACDRCGRSSPTPAVPADWHDDPEPTGALLCPTCVAALGSGTRDSLGQVHRDLDRIRFRLSRVPLRTRGDRNRGLKLAATLDALLDPRDAPASVRLWRWARSLAD